MQFFFYLSFFRSLKPIFFVLFLEPVLFKIARVKFCLRLWQLKAPFYHSYSLTPDFRCPRNLNVANEAQVTIRRFDVELVVLDI